jgi:hypothetical protein
MGGWDTLYFLSSGKMPILHAECSMHDLHLKIGTQITSALVYHVEKERIHSKGILIVKNSRPPYLIWWNGGHLAIVFRDHSICPPFPDMTNYESPCIKS